MVLRHRFVVFPVIRISHILVMHLLQKTIMQMLFDKSFEFGETEGLGLIHGTVELMKPEGNLNIPQMGWNAMEFNEPCSLLKGVDNGESVYFVHSFAAKCNSRDVVAYVDYGGKVTAMVSSGNVFGCQFHPEKSGDTGLKILRNFAEL